MSLCYFQHRIMHICTDFLQLYLREKKTLSITGLVKEWKKLLNKYVDNYVSKVITNHNRADQKMEQIQPYVLQLHFVVTV